MLFDSYCSLEYSVDHFRAVTVERKVSPSSLHLLFFKSDDDAGMHDMVA